MAPPRYSDLLRNANDVLLRGLHYGWWRFVCNTKTNNDMQFTTTGESNINREIIGMFKAKKWFRSHNLALSQRWWSSNEFYTQLSMYDKPIEGLVMSVGENYKCDEDLYSTHFKASYVCDSANFNCFTVIEDKKPPVSAAIVLGHTNFLLGYQTIFDSNEVKLIANNFALGYVDGKFEVHGFFNTGSLNPDNADMKQFALSLWHNATDKIDVGSLIRKRTDADETTFEVGIKYKLDDKAVYRVKINNDMQLGVGWQQGLYSGMVMYLATRVQLDQFWDGGHKLGIGLELNV